MNKFLKIVLVNIFIIIGIVLAAEFYCIVVTYKSLHWDNFKFHMHVENIINSYISPSFFKDYDFRGNIYPEKPTNKAPIAMVGCSYTYGLGLDDNDVPAAMISKETGRIVYNAGVNGGSPREILYILRNDDLRSKLFDNRTDIEYVIYTYISHHLYRLYKDIRPYTYSPYFRVKNSELEYYKPNFLIAKSYLYRKYTDLKYTEEDLSTINGSHDLFFIYMKEINKEIKKHFPNAKFVIIVYDDLTQNDWDKIEKEGIKVIKVSNLSDKDFKSIEYRQSANNYHPKAIVWRILIPKIVGILNL